MRFKELSGKRTVSACIHDSGIPLGLGLGAHFYKKKDSKYEINQKKFLPVYIGNTVRHFIFMAMSAK